MKPTDAMENSGQDDPGSGSFPLAIDILGLLMDAPYSFASLYGVLLRYTDHSDTTVAGLMAELEDMERRSWVTAWQVEPERSGGYHPLTDAERQAGLAAYQAWLPDAPFEDLSVDEVGLWYELTDAGRAEWRRWAGAEQEREQDLWMADASFETGTLAIHAVNREVAQEQLHWWLSTFPDWVMVYDSDFVEPVASFTLRSGVEVRDGVKLTCRIRRSRRRKAS